MVDLSVPFFEARRSISSAWDFWMRAEIVVNSSSILETSFYLQFNKLHTYKFCLVHKRVILALVFMGVGFLWLMLGKDNP